MKVLLIVTALFEFSSCGKPVLLTVILARSFFPFIAFWISSLKTKIAETVRMTKALRKTTIPLPLFCLGRIRLFVELLCLLLVPRIVFFREGLRCELSSTGVIFVAS